ncbi:MAG: atsA 11 [Verrucomicrobiaceae bacterium]|nr:atsA 11 [Verrucomicrobiaceae bacterium]
MCGMNAVLRLLLTGLLLPVVLQAADGKPNIVFILVDDLGWADVGFHGGKVPTPHLDKLVHEGVELTHHYVAPVCSPTRSSLLSGRYWSRFGVTAPQAERAFPWETVTLPRALKTIGYESALTGKWHLGSKPEWGPLKFGFDHSYGSLGGGVGPWNHRYKQGPFTNTWHRDDVLIEEEGHATDLITHDATQWIAGRGDKPFFLYVPFTAVHIPIREPEAYVQRVAAAITDETERHYAACIIHMDESVGKLAEALEKAGKRDNTLIIFSSDNGGVQTGNADRQYPRDNYPPGRVNGNNQPLHGNKADVYEGGIRVPAFVNWPAKLKPGKLDAPIHIADWMPTLCALTGSTPAQGLKWDGQNVWPLISGKEKAQPRTLYWTGPNFRSRALREGDWKLVSLEKGKEPKVELYDLATDPNEANDLAAQNPEKVKSLIARMADVARADNDAKVDNGPEVKE